MSLLQQIESCHRDTTGWCSERKMQTLAGIIFATRPRIVIEIGAWYGKSLLPMATALKGIGTGIVFAVDPWLSGCSVAGQTNVEDVKWWSRQDDHETAYKTFIQSLARLNLKDVVRVNRMHSDEFDPPEGVGLLHIDGNHGNQSIRDVERYCGKVSAGGFVVMDDLNWSSGAVQVAVENLKAMGFKELFTVKEDNEWGVYQKI